MSVPSFAYEARDGRGQRVRGVLVAESERDLDVQLERMQLCLVRARTHSGRERTRAVSAQELADFTYHLSTVVEAGLPLLQGLDDLAAEDGHPLQALARRLARRVRAGAQLSEALRDCPGTFPDVMCALVAAGEQTGRLELVLRDLTRYVEWRLALSRQIRSALAYPTVVVGGIGALSLLLITYVVPAFAGIFEEMGVELPLMTRALLALSQALREHWMLLLTGTAAAGLGAVSYARTARGRHFFHGLWLRLPIMGPLATMLEMSRMSHNLAILYGAGIPLVDGLQMVRQIVQNVRVKDVVQDLHDQLRRGGSLAEAARAHAIVPRMVTRMIAVGESTGHLDEALERASSFYDRELPRTIQRNLSVFNTASVVLLGAAVALLGVSIFVPIYQMLGKLNG